MKPSLLKDIIGYAKTKGKVPLDERQMNILKELYIELARSVIMGFMFLIIAYGYMERQGMQTNFTFLELSMSLLGSICYYYTLRFCSVGVIGIDANFEYLVVPALCFSPFLYSTSYLAICYTFQVPEFFLKYAIVVFILAWIFLYAGLNFAYRKGKANHDQEDHDGELHFHSKKQFMPMIFLITCIIALFPIDRQLFYCILLILGSISIAVSIFFAIFMVNYDEYILGDDHLVFHRDLWGRKGTSIPYSNILHIEQTDTFHVGYAKDKIRITCKNGKSYLLYPENAYTFYEELLSNI